MKRTTLGTTALLSVAALTATDTAAAQEGTISAALGLSGDERLVPRAAVNRALAAVNVT